MKVKGGPDDFFFKWSYVDILMLSNNICYTHEIIPHNQYLTRVL